MECMVRHAVSGDEAQKTPEHRGNRPHLTAAEETPIPETARAIAFKLGKPPTLPNLSFLFYFISTRSSLFFAVPLIFYVGLYFRHVDFLITLGHLNSHNIKTTDRWSEYYWSCCCSAGKTFVQTFMGLDTLDGYGTPQWQWPSARQHMGPPEVLCEGRWF